MRYPQPSVIVRELGPGEELLWSGRPKQGLLLRRGDLLAIPFSLLWGGLVIYWTIDDFFQGYDPVFITVGILFSAIGLYIIAGRFFVDARQRTSTYYGLTNKRALIVTGLFSRQVKSIDLRTLTDISLDERSDGSGTVWLGASTTTGRWFALGNSYPGMKQAPSFELVEDARGVYETIRRAQDLAWGRAT